MIRCVQGSVLRVGSQRFSDFLWRVYTNYRRMVLMDSAQPIMECPFISLGEGRR